ncbi:nucleotidyltransferase domain-containing protein [Frankia sp. R82]|uniref:nucleotidyltransferase domain-containing protein n=1 Tax=Frankia sp. R82 TaxID=2950553 RepID=UPI00204407BD|nr:hypothetical protein [Frankia sp. R82]MCM3883709.1 hypothetical protein [Frankia sp. R82]
MALWRAAPLPRWSAGPLVRWSAVCIGIGGLFPLAITAGVGAIVLPIAAIRIAGSIPLVKTLLASRGTEATDIDAGQSRDVLRPGPGGPMVGPPRLSHAAGAPRVRTNACPDHLKMLVRHLGYVDAIGTTPRVAHDSKPATARRKPVAVVCGMGEYGEMRAEEVTEIVSGLQAEGVTIWLDGGWCVDALVGRQTRPHADLDIAVARADEDKLRAWFSANNYIELSRLNATPANFVLGDASGRQVDVHVFEFAGDGRLRYGVAYPQESLTGHAELNGLPVRCIAAEWMFRFKTAYPPAPQDIADVHALHRRFGFAIPPSHAG